LAVDKFKREVGQYDLSLREYSARSTARTIPRKIQFALKNNIKKLRVAVSRPYLIFVYVYYSPKFVSASSMRGFT
jgi:hypothetical protein